MDTKPEPDAEDGLDIIEGISFYMSVEIHARIRNSESKPRIKCGCTNLIIEMLRRAIFDLTLSEDVRKSAQDWIDDDETIRPFSFGWICEYLNLPMQAVREHAKLVASNHFGLDGHRKRNCRTLIW